MDVKGSRIVFGRREVEALLVGGKRIFRRFAPTPSGLGTYVPPFERGDRLWVGEPWRVVGGAEYAYLKDKAHVGYRYGVPESLDQHRYKPSVTMPMWASRFLLEVESATCERLQAIDHAGAVAEGCGAYSMGCLHESQRLTSGERMVDDLERAAFAVWWDETYDKVATWKDNPMVWVVRFRVLP